AGSSPPLHRTGAGRADAAQGRRPTDRHFNAGFAIGDTKPIKPNIFNLPSVPAKLHSHGFG
ncbi:hypothetical protein, partial [Sulfitobacter sp. M23508]|uniref:hypothetical protein n=1 Tax=Sulfitobacter sp. M23508 TaxID=3368577 RepID=UPI003744C51D